MNFIYTVETSTAEQKGKSVQTNTNMKKVSQHSIPPRSTPPMLLLLSVSLVTIKLDLKLHYLHIVFKEQMHSCSRNSRLLLCVCVSVYVASVGETEGDETRKTLFNFLKLQLPCHHEQITSSCIFISHRCLLTVEVNLND